NGGSYTSREVEDAKLVIKLFPFLAMYIIYWGCQSQMSTTWFAQGCALDLHIGSFTVPVAALNIFNTIPIVALIPVFNYAIYVAMSVFYQVPQFVLIGISEILASVTALEFFYSQAPDNLRSVLAALNLLTVGLGQWLMAAMIAIVNANKCQLPSRPIPSPPFI